MKKINEKLFIAPQLTAETIRQAKAEGITAIINNRPDGEEAGQPSAAENSKVAAAEGLGYTHIPIVPGQITQDKVRAFQDAVAQAPGPVLAHCKTGTRAAMLHVIGEVLDGRMDMREIAPLGQTLGTDLSGAEKWLSANGH
ncbi:TIGR01244 family phosphatase [Mesorhizobium sp. NBSH29]|nr:TIGR01244 family phosphatase [Mesorhizobium sp. NBSH29]